MNNLFYFSSRDNSSLDDDLDPELRDRDGHVAQKTWYFKNPTLSNMYKEAVTEMRNFGLMLQELGGFRSQLQKARKNNYRELPNDANQVARNADETLGHFETGLFPRSEEILRESWIDLKIDHWERITQQYIVDQVVAKIADPNPDNDFIRSFVELYLDGNAGSIVGLIGNRGLLNVGKLKHEQRFAEFDIAYGLTFSDSLLHGTTDSLALECAEEVFNTIKQYIENPERAGSMAKEKKDVRFAEKIGGRDYEVDLNEVRSPEVMEREVWMSEDTLAGRTKEFDGPSNPRP